MACRHKRRRRHTQWHCSHYDPIGLPLYITRASLVHRLHQNPAFYKHRLQRLRVERRMVGQTVRAIHLPAYTPLGDSRKFSNELWLTSACTWLRSSTSCRTISSCDQSVQLLRKSSSSVLDSILIGCGASPRSCSCCCCLRLCRAAASLQAQLPLYRSLSVSPPQRVEGGALCGRLGAQFKLCHPAFQYSNFCFTAQKFSARLQLIFAEVGRSKRCTRL